MADAFLMPRGVIPRMAILACGRETKDGKFRDATDAKWWSTTYKFALWNPLGTYATAIDSIGGSYTLDWDEGIANGVPTSLTMAIPRVAAILDEIRRARWDHCAPWLLPRARAPGDKPGMMPTVNVLCTKIPDGTRDIIEKIKVPDPRKGAGWILLVALLLLAARKR